MSELLSFGCGVNSVALAILLVNEGRRGPIVYADTGSEWPETYCYLSYFEREWLAPRGLSVTTLGGEWRAPAKRPTLIEYCEGHHMIPLAGIRWCTAEYKVGPLQKWAVANGIETQLLGIAADESHRQPLMHRPLVDRNVSRQDCVDIIVAEGLDVPQKSGCYICPFQRDSVWRELWHRHLDLFERAARLEEAATAKRGGAPVFLAASGKITLRERQYRYEHQGSLLDDADWDALLAYRPCLCSL